MIVGADMRDTKNSSISHPQFLILKKYAILIDAFLHFRIRFNSLIPKLLKSL